MFLKSIWVRAHSNCQWKFIPLWWTSKNESSIIESLAFGWKDLWQTKVTGSQRASGWCVFPDEIEKIDKKFFLGCTPLGFFICSKTNIWIHLTCFGLICICRSVLRPIGSALVAWRLNSTNLVLPRRSVGGLASVVQRVDRAVHWINHYSADECYQN